MAKGKSIVRAVALSTTQPTLICGPSEKRLSLLFSPPGNASAYCTISTDPSVTLGAGINLSLAGGVVVISAEAFGDAPVRPWYGIASLAAVVVGVMETIDM